MKIELSPNPELMSVVEILPHIYHCTCEKFYTLAMHFIRFSEYQDSPQFEGQIFKLIDFMEWYAEEYGNGIFSYPEDWSGYNVSSDTILAVRNSEIPDRNKYDDFIFSVVDKVKEKEGDNFFFFIGTAENHAALDHELAHAFYNSNDEYKEKMNDLINNLKNNQPKLYNQAINYLVDSGYCESTHYDEIQAYYSTGVEWKIGFFKRRHLKPFVAIFQEYKKKMFESRILYC